MLFVTIHSHKTFNVNTADWIQHVDRITRKWWDEKAVYIRLYLGHKRLYIIETSSFFNFEIFNLKSVQRLRQKRLVFLFRFIVDFYELRYLTFNKPIQTSSTYNNTIDDCLLGTVILCVSRWQNVFMLVRGIIAFKQK